MKSWIPTRRRLPATPSRSNRLLPRHAGTRRCGTWAVGVRGRFMSSAHDDEVDRTDHRRRSRRVRGGCGCCPCRNSSLFDLDGVLDITTMTAPAWCWRSAAAAVSKRFRAPVRIGLDTDADMGLHDAQGQVDELVRRLGTTGHAGRLHRGATRSDDRRSWGAGAGATHRVHVQVAILSNNNCC